MLGIKGRSRKIQLELAREHGLLENYYACGGCLLTDVNFASRMRDFLKFTRNPKMEDIHILKHGRHFRVKNTKIIVGRNETENNMLLKFRKHDDLILEAKDVPGPITIIQGEFDEETFNYAAMLTLRYSDSNELLGKVIYGTDYDDLSKEITVKRENEEKLKKYIL